MALKVCKFGGTSLASAEQFRKVAQIALADSDRKIVVVSAPGKRNKPDTKVTDMLIAYAEAFLAGQGAEEVQASILERFAGIIEGLELPKDEYDTIARILTARGAGDRSHRARYIDSIKALGEEFSARLLAAFLRKEGHDFIYVDPKEAGLVLSDEPGNAQVLPESYDNLRPLRDSEHRIIFPGFYGYAASGNLVAFPRGGSDITGAILAAAVQADVYENFTDVDNVFAADPRIVDVPAAIHEMTYSEMRELSYAGFSVLHDEALQPAFNAKIPVHIRNTNNPESRGTLISLERNNDELPVVGVAGSSDFCAIFLSKYLMNREKGFGRRLLQIIEEAGLSYEHTPSGIDHISVIIKQSTLTPEIETLVLERIRSELQPDKLIVRRGIALIMIVGDGMTKQIGIAKRATGALADSQVNLEMINQGASENSIMFGIQNDDMNKAIVALHGAFFNKK
ncbi:aspartate kinase [Paenibacillus ginsengarvi]|uniref:Aspartokinase n=1 Tax=Paenibacillus ginsengarvi TaxID=400777 RepID=A0A3B0CIN4_9BACL|nr:aspartate kinase [Paenibacillus ginsengarvi]RKN84711.1 aspartate kinase [Paenibacillus ginsengarvi]